MTAALVQSEEILARCGGLKSEATWVVHVPEFEQKLYSHETGEQSAGLGRKLDVGKARRICSPVLEGTRSLKHPPGCLLPHRLLSFSGKSPCRL